MEQLAWGLTFDPVLERDSVYPATQYFQHAVLRGCLLLSTMKPIAGVSLGRKPPWSADCHPEVFHHFSALSLSSYGWEREENLNKTEDTRGTIVLRGHLNPLQTVSTSVRSGWIDRHCVGRRQKRAFSLWAVTLKRLQCCFVVHERDLGSVSFQLQLNYAVVPAKRFCLGQKMKRGLKFGAFLPMAHSFGRVKKIIVVHIKLKKKRRRRRSRRRKKKHIKVGMECGRDRESKGADVTRRGW